MTIVKEAEFEKDVAKFLRKVKKGEQLRIVSGRNKAIAELSPLPSKKTKKGKRPFGLAKGEFKVTKEFFDPLPKEILKHFGGE